MFDENDPNLSITNNTELQEKLSDYLDIVEMNLVDEIAKFLIHFSAHLRY